MNSLNLKELITLAFRAPDQAMRQVAQLGLSPQAVWMLLLLITVVASLVSSAVLFALPQDDPQLKGLIENMLAYRAPIIFCALQFAQAVLGVYAIALIGKAMEGQAAPHDIALGFVLIQIVALLLAVVLSLVSMLVPAIDSFGILGILIWGIWASVAVIDVAHGFGSRLKAFGVLFLAGVVTIFATIAVMSLIGVPASQAI